SNFALALAYFHTQRYGDAAAAARSAIDSNPAFSLSRAVLAAALFRLGLVEDAQAAAQSFLQHYPSFSIRGSVQIVDALEPAVIRPLADAWREVGLPE